MSPRLLRQLAISLRAAANALSDEADELEQRAPEHRYEPVPNFRRRPIEKCTRCGAMRTTDKPWKFMAPGASTWSSRKPPACKAVTL